MSSVARADRHVWRGTSNDAGIVWQIGWGVYICMGCHTWTSSYAQARVHQPCHKCGSQVLPDMDPTRAMDGPRGPRKTARTHACERCKNGEGHLKFVASAPHVSDGDTVSTAPGVPEVVLFAEKCNCEPDETGDCPHTSLEIDENFANAMKAIRGRRGGRR